ncbi:hypothetical protein GJA_2011 [Janthinobacterium agaricidamnosum NBRC 102515 = DSM 9628]|uniref:Uncharacterized protein n=1 Tax=Janthinobacterium agaricidamnosum NBRC 102515 = DSM 9628 TaxID=1349767 RepID=W0V5V3_9BURK|nr:hypothetical protein GJA_2011 [Janthinobacterium agaricidamnosum NBRC 102515 = DSM 9628]
MKRAARVRLLHQGSGDHAGSPSGRMMRFVGSHRKAWNANLAPLKY